MKLISHYPLPVKVKPNLKNKKVRNKASMNNVTLMSLKSMHEPDSNETFCVLNNFDDKMRFQLNDYS